MRVSSEYSSLILASFFTSQHTSLFLPYNPIGVLYGYDFFYWRKELVKADLSNTFNMFMESIENFLETLQKKNYLQKYYHPSQL